MKVIKNGDKRVLSIIKKKTLPDKRYRLSGFKYSFSEDHVHLLHNTLTGMTVSLSEPEWEWMKHLLKEPGSITGSIGSEENLCLEAECISAGKSTAGGAEFINADQSTISVAESVNAVKSMTGPELMAAGLEELVRYGFFVEEGTDDYEQYELAVSILKTMSREKKGTKTYTILPTTGCNARCIYCYEEGMPVYTMSEETADRVADFIDETRWQDKVKIIWFGGEPLAGSRIISRICTRLTKKDIPFSSKIITNATLLTPELLEEAISLWHLKSAQVSVDGKRQDYEARKQFINTSAHNYDSMMNAVEMLLERGIKVNIRCNYDGGNQSGLTEFFDDIKARFGSPNNLSVYLAMLFQAHADESCVDLYRNIQELNAYLRELGLKKKDKSDKPYKLKQNHCEADSGDKSVVIAPDGRLYHCEHLPGNTAFGSIFDTKPAIRSGNRADDLMPAIRNDDGADDLKPAIISDEIVPDQKSVNYSDDRADDPKPAIHRGDGADDPKPAIISAEIIPDHKSVIYSDDRADDPKLVIGSDDIVFNHKSIIHSDNRASLPANEICRNCCFLPLCTPFYRNGCPDYFTYCREFKQIETDEKLRQVASEINASKH